MEQVPSQTIVAYNLDESSYPTLTPVLQMYIKRLWMTGKVGSAQEAANRIQELDDRVDARQATRYMLDHIHLPDWEEERDRCRAAQYEALLQDEAMIATPIDAKFDRMFGTMSELMSQDLGVLRETQQKALELQKEHPDDPDFEVLPMDPRQLKSRVEAIKTLYLCQRMARGLSTSNHAIGVKHKVESESREYAELERELEGDLKEALETEDVLTLESLEG